MLIAKIVLEMMKSKLIIKSMNYLFRKSKMKLYILISKKYIPYRFYFKIIIIQSRWRGFLSRKQVDKIRKTHNAAIKYEEYSQKS